MKHFHAELRNARGQQGLRRDHAHVRRAEDVQRVDQRARDPRVQDVADDRDGQPVDAPLFEPDREQVEQRLRLATRDHEQPLIEQRLLSSLAGCIQNEIGE